MLLRMRRSTPSAYARACLLTILAMTCAFSTPSAAKGVITESQVLVVYNGAATNATALKDAYLAVHPAIPAANVLNLNSAVLAANPADLTYQQFKDEIRDPIRNYLSAAGDPTPEGIVSIVLIRPLPHRIKDSDNPFVGDSGSTGDINTGDANYASVESELVLLWQNLDTGEAGGTMDSKTDNMIDNPYHQSVDPIDTCSNCARTNIQMAKTLFNTSNFYWRLGGTGAARLTPGDMYLVCRIDGNSLADAEAALARAQNLRINKATTWVLFDEFNVNGGANDLDDDGLGIPNDPFLAGDDYEETEAILISDGWNTRYDGSIDFIDSTEETRPLIGIATYGENHDLVFNCEDPPGFATYIDNYNFPPGAIFNTIESDNGRALNGLSTVFGLEQVADFVAAGGTLGVGSVWEPFSFTLPDNEFLMVRFLIDGFSFAEAAYSSLPALSWTHVVVGDPLATATILNDAGLPKGDLNGDGNVDGLDIAWYTSLVLDGPADYYAAFPTLDPIARGDFTGDFQVALDDMPDFVAALLP